MPRPTIPRIRLHPFSISYLDRKNPWTVVWWSATLPGFGHVAVGQHLKGLVLMSWEILVNHQSHLNTAIFYTLQGQYDQAKAVIDYRWALVYPLFYMFSMFDSYRLCVQTNHMTRTERLQTHRHFDRITSSPAGTTMLFRHSPTMAAIWSAAVSGFGQLYCDRGVKAFILMGWYVVVVYRSGLALAAYYTLQGEFGQAAGVLDYQWLLFWPSIYLFGIADAYQDAAEQNQIIAEAFRYRLRKYIRK